HEMGGVRKGKDPKTSLLNKWKQLHACKNVFVTDGACMTSTATQNPSLTYMALTARAANYAGEELGKRNLSHEIVKYAAVVNNAVEKGAVEIREIDRPAIGEDDVLLEVAHVGVCGSDLHQWTCDHSWPVNYPVVLGHEFAGTVVETGKRVAGWK